MNSWWKRLFRSAKSHPLRSLRRHSARTGLEVLEDRCVPAVLTVNTNLDNTDADGLLSLREAVALVNESGDAMAALGRDLDSGELGQVNTTGPFGTDDTITFDPTVFATPQTITLGGTQLPDLSADVTISGPGAKRLTLNAGGTSRHLFVNSGVTVQLSGLTLQGGNGADPAGSMGGQNGGSIHNLGTLFVTACTFSGNSSADGGGIYNAGMATVTACTFTNNGAGLGGGIDNQGTLEVTNSTFSGNQASPGGAIYNESLATVTSCTITGNRTGNGGGGILNAGTLTLTSSIVAGNTKNQSQADDIEGVDVEDGGFNLIGDVNTSGGLTNTNGNLVGVANPLLGPLEDNGGPTPTIALLAGSPAIDAGLAGDLGTDQRGSLFRRSSGTSADIGAYEAQSIALIVDKFGDIDDEDHRLFQLTLREAVTLADANPGPETIFFDPETFLSGGQAVIALTSELLLSRGGSENKTTIMGLAANELAVSGNNVTRVFRIISNAHVDISGLTITGGNVNDRGGGLFNNRSKVNLTNVVVTGNRGIDGGGIFNNGTSGILTLDGCTVSDNTADASGGGIVNEDGMLTILNSALINNTAGGHGGGLLTVADPVLTNVTISGNRAALSGGGIAAFALELTLTNVTITDNHADNDNTGGETGGGVYSTSFAPTTLRNTIIYGNYRGSGTTTADDLAGDGANTVTANFSLIGTSTAVTVNGVNNLSGDPRLGPLANNGGATLTHALLSGSAALNAGDPDTTDLPDFDQRGDGFARVKAGRIDLGAYEVDAVFAGSFAGEDGSDLGDDFTLLNGRFTLVNGQAVVQGNKPGQATVDGVTLADVSLDLDITLAGNGSRAGVIARYSPKQGSRSESYYWARLIRRNGQVRAEILRFSNGKVKEVASARVTIQGSSARIRFEVLGNSLNLFVNGELAASGTDNGLREPGLVGIRARTGAALDNLVVNPLMAFLRRQQQSGHGES